MHLRRLFLCLLAVGATSACATQGSTIAHRVDVPGPAVQEQPQTLSHWQVLAERVAEQAAPQLRHVAVSPRAQGITRNFDAAFHDFFITALHRRGVAIDEGGARVEIDTYPMVFPDHPYQVRSADGRRGVAPALEFGVNVRVFDGPRLAFSGSDVYYLPASDYHNYRRWVRPVVKMPDLIRVEAE